MAKTPVSAAKKSLPPWLANKNKATPSPVNAEKQAKADMANQVLTKMGETPNNGGAGQQQQQAPMDPMQIVKMPAAQAFPAAGLNPPTPEMAQLWDKVSPQDRIAILDAITSASGGPDDDSMGPDAQDQGEAPATGPVAGGGGMDPRAALLAKMGVQ